MEDEAVKVEVIELNSNKPVPGASVTLYKCTKYDFVFGCLDIGVSSHYLTNQNGIAAIRNADYFQANEGLRISKSGYWTRNGGQGRNELCPEGWIQLNIKRTSLYPDSLFFYLFNMGENTPSIISAGGEVLKMKQRADTTALIRAFGSQKNALTWIVGQKFQYWYGISFDSVASASLTPVTVPANDTIHLSLEY